MVKRKCFGCTLWFFLHVMLIGSTRAASSSGSSSRKIFVRATTLEKQRRQSSTTRKASSSSGEPTQPKRVRKRALSAISYMPEEADFATAGSAKRKRLSSRQEGSMTNLEDEAVLPQDGPWQTVVRRKTRRNRRLGKPTTDVARSTPYLQEITPDQGARQFTHGTKNAIDHYAVNVKNYFAPLAELSSTSLSSSPVSARQTQTPPKSSVDNEDGEVDDSKKQPKPIDNVLALWKSIVPGIEDFNERNKDYPTGAEKYFFRDVPKDSLADHDDKDDCVVEFRTSLDFEYFKNRALRRKLYGVVLLQKELIQLVMYGDKQYTEKRLTIFKPFQEYADQCNLVDGQFLVEPTITKKKVGPEDFEDFTPELVMSFHVGPKADVPYFKGLTHAPDFSDRSCVVSFLIKKDAVDYWERMVAANRLIGAVDTEKKMMQLILDGDTSERKVFEHSYEGYAGDCQFVGGKDYLPIVSTSTGDGRPEISFFLGASKKK